MIILEELGKARESKECMKEEKLVVKKLEKNKELNQQKGNNEYTYIGKKSFGKKMKDLWAGYQKILHEI